MGTFSIVCWVTVIFIAFLFGPGSTTTKASANVTVIAPVTYSTAATQRESTTNRPTTTERETTSSRPTTTQGESTTNRPTTTEWATTTSRPSTTESETTSSRPTTTERESTTSRRSTTERETTSSRPTTTDEGKSTTDLTTTERETTTSRLSTTEGGTTSRKPTTTDKGQSTTDLTTADERSTTDQSSTTSNTTQQTTTLKTTKATTTGKTTKATTIAEETTISFFEKQEERLQRTFNTTGNLTTEEVEEVLEIVVDVTADPEFFDEEPERVELVINSLETLVEVGDTSVNVTDPVVEIVNNLMEVDEDVITDGTLQGGRVIAALEEQVTNAQSNEGNFTRTLENLGVVAAKIDKEVLVSSLTFANIFTDNSTPMLGADLRDNSAKVFADEGDIPVNRVTSSIAIPTTVIDLLQNAGEELTEVPVSFFIYGNAVLFTPSRPTVIPEEDESTDTNTTEMVVSQVISAVIETETISITKLPIGSQNVRTKFVTHIELTENEAMDGKPECVYWDYDRETGKGFWSTDGCTMLAEESDRTVCSCNRLASFAVLVRVRKGSPEVQVVLYFITVIGSVISGICLILCIITFLSLKTYRSKLPTYIHLNLCFSLLGFYLVFLLSSLATRDRNLCSVASAAIHFSCLATVAWMSVEAVNLYYLFVKREKTTSIRRFILVACLFAYGCPGACALLVALLDTNLSFQNADYCFIHPGPALYFGFLAEVAILFFLNLVVFSLVLRKALCRPLMASSTQENARRNEVITRVRHGIFFWFVLGLSWLFGFLSAIDEATLIFDYLYCICIAIQGLMMFLLLCVANPEFRKVFIKNRHDTSQTSGSRLASTKTSSKSKLTEDSRLDSQTGIQMNDVSGVRSGPPVDHLDPPIIDRPVEELKEAEDIQSDYCTNWNQF